jgi:hypothetical protein
MLCQLAEFCFTGLFWNQAAEALFCAQNAAGDTMSASRSAAHFCARLLLGIVLTAASSRGFAVAQSSQQSEPSQKDKAAPVVPRGKKLVLTDGTYQVIREYQRNGERVRYYSLERGDWEEVPASMVDWDATAKAASDAEKASAAEVEKIHRQEEARRMDNVTDIDASLPVGKGAFLPDSEGMYVVEGKTVRVLDQVSSQLKTDKMRALAQILSPVPLVPGKKTVELPGTHAALRIKTPNPEFYLREVAPDPDRVSSIQKSKRAGDAGPDVELIKAKVTRTGRLLESINVMFGQELPKQVNAISIQRWEVAPSVYRFTLSGPLPPGEYVLAQVVEQGLDLFVWEFGVDGPAVAPAK